MDPLFITASCISLSTTVTKCSYALSGFIREVLGAKGDLNRIAAELESLTGILQLLENDARRMSQGSLPPSLLDQLNSIIDKCNGVVVEIEESIEKHRRYSFGAATYWTIGGGKDDMAKFRSNLEAHKSALQMGCDIIHFSVMRDIQNNTRMIRHQTAVMPTIKNDTEQIREIAQQIERLRRRLGPRSGPGSNILLHRFLEESTTYAESVVEESISSDEGFLSRMQNPRSSVRRPEPRFRHDPHQLGSSNNEGPVDPFNYVPDTSHVHRRVRNPRTRSDSHRSSMTTTVQGQSDYTTTSTSTFDKSVEAYHKSSLPQSHVHNSFHGTSNRQFHSNEHSRTPSQVTFPGHHAQGTPVFSHVPVGPTSIRDFQNHLRRPDDWHWMTLNHAVPTDPDSPHSTAEFSSHQYTCMTRGLSFLAHLGFTLRQRREHPEREIMLLVGVQMPDVRGEHGHDAAARFMTTIESIMEALRTADEACDPPPTHSPWWTKVVICLLHSDTSTIYEHGLTSNGMQLRCDPTSEHCGTAPHQVLDEDGKIYAHLWEHTTSRSQFSWDWKGTPELPTQGRIPLQLIQCQFTSRAGPLTELSGKGHIESFITMLDAGSCICVPAGQKIDKYDVLNAYDAAQRIRSAKPVEELRSYPKGMKMDSFMHAYAGVPTDYTSLMRR